MKLIQLSNDLFTNIDLAAFIQNWFDINCKLFAILFHLFAMMQFLNCTIINALCNVYSVTILVVQPVSCSRVQQTKRRLLLEVAKSFHLGKVYCAIIVMSHRDNNSNCLFFHCCSDVVFFSFNYFQMHFRLLHI